MQVRMAGGRETSQASPACDKRPCIRRSPNCSNAYRERFVKHLQAGSKLHGERVA